MSSDRKMPDDRELEDFLAGRHPVGKAYREASEHETAPPELDAAILTAAREAVRTPRARRPRWFQPVAVAATLALSLGVLLNIWRDPETREQMAPAESSDLDRMKTEVLEERVPSAVVEAKKEAGPVPPEPTADAGASVVTQSAPAQEVEAEIERRSDAVAARRESKSLQRDEPRKAKEGAAMNSADAVLSAGAAAPKAQAPAPAPGKPEPSPPKASQSAPAASAGSSSGFAPEPPAAAPPPPPAPITAPSPGAQRAAPLGAAAGRTFDDRVEQQAPRQEKAPRDESKDAKRARDFAAPSMSGGSGARSGVASEEDGTATGALAPRAPSVTSPVAPAAKSSQPEAEADSDRFAPAPPEDWIRRIRELRDGGDITAAWRLLESFRARYPDYVLPKDLRELQPP